MSSIILIGNRELRTINGTIDRPDVQWVQVDDCKKVTQNNVDFSKFRNLGWTIFDNTLTPTVHQDFFKNN